MTMRLIVLNIFLLSTTVLWSQSLFDFYSINLGSQNSQMTSLSRTAVLNNVSTAPALNTLGFISYGSYGQQTSSAYHIIDGLFSYAQHNQAFTISLHRRGFSASHIGNFIGSYSRLLGKAGIGVSYHYSYLQAEGEENQSSGSIDLSAFYTPREDLGFGIAVGHLLPHLDDEESYIDFSVGGSYSVSDLLLLHMSFYYYQTAPYIGMSTEYQFSEKVKLILGLGLPYPTPGLGFSFGFKESFSIDFSFSYGRSFGVPLGGGLSYFKE